MSAPAEVMTGADGGIYPISNSAIVRDGVACYCRGTLIATTQGERPVEDLAIGDLLITASVTPPPIR